MTSHPEKEDARGQVVTPELRAEPAADAGEPAPVATSGARPRPLPEPFPTDLVALAAIAASLIGTLAPDAASGGLIEIGRAVGWTLAALLTLHGLVTVVAFVRDRAARSAASPPRGGDGRLLARSALSWLQASIVGAVTATWEGDVRTLVWLSLALVAIHLGWRIVSVKLGGRDLPSLSRLGGTVLLGLGPALAAVALLSSEPAPVDLAGNADPGRTVPPGDIGGILRPNVSRGATRLGSSADILRRDDIRASARPGSDVGGITRPDSTAVILRPGDTGATARPDSAVATVGLVAASLGWVVLGLAACLPLFRVRTEVRARPSSQGWSARLSASSSRLRPSLRALSALRLLAIVGAVASLLVAVWTDGSTTAFGRWSPFHVGGVLAGIAVLVGFVPRLASSRARTSRPNTIGTQGRAIDTDDDPAGVPIHGASGEARPEGTSGIGLPDRPPSRRRNSRRKEARRKLQIAHADRAG